MAGRGVPEPVWVVSKEHAELFLVIGELARFFHTPLPVWFDMDVSEINLWVEVMNELRRREAKAMEEASKGSR